MFHKHSDLPSMVFLKDFEVNSMTDFDFKNHKQVDGFLIETSCLMMNIF